MCKMRVAWISMARRYYILPSMFRHILKFESNYAFRLSLSAWILLIPLLIHIPNPQWWTMTRCPLQSVGLVGTTVRCLNASEICCLSLDLACLLLHLWRPLQHRPPTLQLYNLVSVKYSGHQRIYLVLCVSISACDCPFPIRGACYPGGFVFHYDSSWHQS